MKQTVASLVVAFLVTLSLTAWATPGWIWLDEAGNRVYSDMPPPSSVPNNRIVQQPAPRMAPSSAATTAPTVPPPPATASASGTTTPAPPGGAAAQTPESIEAQNAAIERRNAEIRADNCKRARESLVTLKQPGRLATVNEQGQRVIMDAAMRRAETERAEQIIRDNCR